MAKTISEWTSVLALYLCIHQSLCNMSKCILETRSATLCCSSSIIASFTHHIYVGLPTVQSSLISCSSLLAINAAIVKMPDLIIITLIVSRSCIALCTHLWTCLALVTLACLKLLHPVFLQTGMFMPSSLFAGLVSLLLQRL